MSRGNALVRWASDMIGKEFSWGETDCATITLQGIAIFHGSSPFIPFQRETNTRSLQRETITFPLLRGAGGRIHLPKWISTKEALRVQRKYGKTSEFLTMHGWTEIPKNYARTGDVAVIQTSPMQTAAIVINRSVLLIDPESGVQLQPLTTISNHVIFYRLFRPVSRGIKGGLCHKP